MTKPTFVFVPGCWLPVDIYSRTIDFVSAHGYATVALPLASTGAAVPHKDFWGDVESIRQCLSTLVESQEKEVILVLHSYTGMPGSQAPEGLSKKEREFKGLKGGVVRLVYIMSYVPPAGFQPTAGGAQFPSWMLVDLEKGVVRVDPEEAKTVFFNDLDEEEAGTWAGRLLPQSLGVYGSTTTYAAWKDIPSTYVIGEQDKTFFQPEVIEMIIQGARALEPSALDTVEKCNGGHCLMISHAEWLSLVLRRAAGENI
ncbi:Alpha/beta hydrolase fold-1 [Xylariales sp. PMI_506]|nr:Alpha/beta hydrolase fold-1 [Xylariales sp. PMI_506]